MFSSMSKPTTAYRQVSLDASIQEADPHRLILMLFEGATAALTTARFAMQDGNIAAKGVAISKAIDIITNGLGASLDTERGGDLAVQLSALYDYMASRLLWANMKNDLAVLDEVHALIADIHDAWKQIDPAKSQTGQTSG